MTTRVFAIMACLFMVSCSGINNRREAKMINDFVLPGLSEPGDSLEIFMPGVISCTGTHDAAITISPEGDEIFFARGIWPDTRIFTLKWDGTAWQGPDTADFSRRYLASEPAFSPDGLHVYFSSSLGKSDSSSYSICRVGREGDGWSDPEQLFDLGGDTIWEFHPSVTAGNRLYFCRWSKARSSGDIYYSELSEGKYPWPVKAEEHLNSEYSDVDPFIDTDGRFVIFTSNRPGGQGNYDQYISFANSSGGWDEPVNMGNAFNDEGDNIDIDLSPDGKYLFVYRDGDIFWKLSEKFVNQSY